MTCVWVGILAGLENKMFPNGVKPTPLNFVKFLKEHNIRTKHVIVCSDQMASGSDDILPDFMKDGKLSESQIEENFESIKEFDPNTIDDGYYCSTCDPFLILICEIFKINILHNYCGNMIKYTYIVDNEKDESSKESEKIDSSKNYTIHLSSNRGHLHHVKTSSLGNIKSHS